MRTKRLYRKTAANYFQLINQRPRHWFTILGQFKWNYGATITEQMQIINSRHCRLNVWNNCVHRNLLCKNQFAVAIIVWRYDENGDIIKKTLLGAIQRCRYRRNADLEYSTIDELKYTQSIKILPGPKKLCWYIGEVLITEADAKVLYNFRINSWDS